MVSPSGLLIPGQRYTEEKYAMSQREALRRRVSVSRIRERGGTSGKGLRAHDQPMPRLLLVSAMVSPSSRRGLSDAPSVGSEENSLECSRR